MTKAQKTKPPPLAWFLVPDPFDNKKKINKNWGRLSKLLRLQPLSLGTTSNQGHWIRGEMFLQGFLPTIPGCSKQSKWPSKYPISQVPQPETLAWGNSSTEYWGTEELYWFGRSLKVSSHVCLPRRPTERETERPPGEPAIKHHKAGLFWRYLFNFMHGSSHICFPPFPISFIFLF